MGLKFNIEEEREEEILAEINMTPLIDIFLVLLIIFMVTSSISLETGLDIELPKTSSKSEIKEGKAVVISLNASKEISVQGRKIDQANLKSEITTFLKSEQTTEVIFEGDTSASIGKMIEIMDIAKEAGANKFSVATDAKNP